MNLTLKHLIYKNLITEIFTNKEESYNKRDKKYH